MGAQHQIDLLGGLKQNRLSHVIDFQRDNKRFTDFGGWIYFVKCHEFVKIGLAKDVGVRLSGLQSGCPYPLILIGCVPTDNMRRDEVAIHNLFDCYHERGEWFKLPEPLIMLIAMLTGENKPVIAPRIESQRPLPPFPGKKKAPKPYLKRNKARLSRGWIAFGVKADPSS